MTKAFITNVPKKKFPIVVTPPVVIGYSWLSRPDVGQKYSDDKYKATALFPKGDDTFKAVLRTVASLNKDVIKDGDNQVDRFGKPKDKPNEAFFGHWTITFKTKFQPQLVDAKRQTLPADVKIMSGDVVKIAFTPREYEEGKVTFDLNAVQLIEKRNVGRNFANAFDEEEGYTAGTGADPFLDEDGGGDPGEAPDPADKLDF